MTENATLTSNLVARLRARTIIVPKPGTEPFVPTQPFWVTSDAGPHQAGEEAGLQYLPSFSTLGSSNAPMRVQAHVYVVEPLCEEAAEEIERLRADAERYRWIRRRIPHILVGGLAVSGDSLADCTDPERCDAVVTRAMNADETSEEQPK